MGRDRRRGAVLAIASVLLLHAPPAAAVVPTGQRLQEEGNATLPTKELATTLGPPPPPSAAAAGVGRQLTEVCFAVEMNDAYGDGWNGAAYTLENAAGAVEGTGTLASGASGTDEWCELPPGECYSLTVTSGTYPSEISWKATQGGAVMAEGGAPATERGLCVTFPPSSSPTTTPSPTTAAIDTYDELKNALERGVEHIALAPGFIDFPDAITIGDGARVNITSLDGGGTELRGQGTTRLFWVTDGASVAFDGISFVDGYAWGQNSGAFASTDSAQVIHGGGCMLVDGTATSVVVRNGEFRNCWCGGEGAAGFGGGLFVRGLGLPSATLVDVSFRNCTAAYQAGAVAVEGTGASLTVVDSSFTDCEAPQGGCAYVGGPWGGTRGSPTGLFHGVSFTRCRAYYFGSNDNGPANGNGGALYAHTAELLEVSGATFEDCEADATVNGGGDDIFIQDTELVCRAPAPW